LPRLASHVHVDCASERGRGYVRGNGPGPIVRTTGTSSRGVSDPPGQRRNGGTGHEGGRSRPDSSNKPGHSGGTKRRPLRVRAARQVRHLLKPSSDSPSRGTSCALLLTAL